MKPKRRPGCNSLGRCLSSLGNFLLPMPETSPRRQRDPASSSLRNLVKQQPPRLLFAEAADVHDTRSVECA